MAFSLSVEARYASSLISHLQSKKLVDKGRKISDISGHVHVPIVAKSKYESLSISEKVSHEIGSEVSVSEIELPTRQKKMNFKDHLSKILSEDELSLVKTSYDVVGDLAVVEIDEELRDKEKTIAEALIESNKSVKGVFRKSGSHTGRFRTQKMKHLAGVRRKETVHRENNVRLKLDIEKVYFSARQSTERKRVSSLVKRGENVIVLFSGCAPFPCVIAKNSDVNDVCAVEVNPVGHDYALKNIGLNKLSNVYAFNRDASDLSGIRSDIDKVFGSDMYFDRVVMPHPTDAISYIDTAIALSSGKSVIHFYKFSEEGKEKDDYSLLKNTLKEKGVSPRLIRTVRCGQHSPGVNRVCFDVSIRR